MMRRWGFWPVAAAMAASSASWSFFIFSAILPACFLDRGSVGMVREYLGPRKRGRGRAEHACTHEEAVEK
jgi:hypothetical protein